jgi:hypothetical protein
MKRRKMMSDFKEKLIEVIAAKVIMQGHMTDLKMPEGFGKLRWTGWKESWGEMYPHAQIVWILERKSGQDRKCFYVDLPSMSHGSVKQGAAFDMSFNDVKSHYLSEHTTAEEIREWFKEGFSLLIDDVLNECPWLTEVPTVKN